ncbi:transglutaminase-like cysteine peptidase [Rhizobium sp. 32-5/1]|uniref:transglutaminase-like cysteine peptidase n=1 Tax=Rhizobium sp. 32-5/1 TaxID=3019602 RepID=UPI00240E136B|nr:transglutaminase-like cysteine peptidase [Rhizobium sp. 32-5/1]WEZ81971.1 transglutaminase-like cysteine peptidase [Rhizobium sp. 32-5/1]
MKKNIRRYALAVALAFTAFPGFSSAKSGDEFIKNEVHEDFYSSGHSSVISPMFLYFAHTLRDQIGTIYLKAVEVQIEALEARIQTGGIPTIVVSPSAVRSKERKTPTTSATKAVFGTVAFPLKRLGALKKFRPSFSQIADGSALNCEAKNCNAAAVSIKAAYSRVAQSSLRDKLNDINATVNNAIRYSRDIDTYKTTDSWAMPSETLKRQTGDCEDFAILKMAALHAGGVSMEDMAIVVLYDQKRRFYHAVLSVSGGDRYYILDNMRNAVMTDDQLTEYVPLYSIHNGRGYFHGLPVSRSKQIARNMLPFEKVAPGEGSAL